MTKYNLKKITNFNTLCMTSTSTVYGSLNPDIFITNVGKEGLTQVMNIPMCNSRAKQLDDPTIYRKLYKDSIQKTKQRFYK